MANAKKLTAVGAASQLAVEIGKLIEANAGTGPQGPQGPQGEQGPQGPAGADGADGADGSDATVTYAAVSALSGDWKGTGAATLTAALTDLETRLAALEP